MIGPITEADEAIRDTTRRFSVDCVAPRAAEIDETDEFFFDLMRQAGTLGLIGLETSEALGGAGASPVAAVLATMEISAVSPAVAATIGAVRTQVALLERFGSAGQQARYLPRLLAGEGVCALGITEPDGGSDLAGGRTHAVRDGDDFVLNGEKNFTSMGDIADMLFVLAYTDRVRGHRDGMTLFLVDRDSPGLGFGRREKKLGQRGVPLTSEIFENVRVPAGCVLGRPGDGYRIITSVLATTRTDVAAQALGLSAGCLDIARRHSLERRQFGRPIAEFQSIQNKLVDMHVEIEAGTLLALKAASARWRGGGGLEAAVAKLFCTDRAVIHASEAIQVLGGYGYLRSNPLERLFRDAKVLQIWDGTSEIQRNIIGRSIARAAGGRAG